MCCRNNAYDTSFEDLTKLIHKAGTLSAARKENIHCLLYWTVIFNTLQADDYSRSKLDDDFEKNSFTNDYSYTDIQSGLYDTSASSGNKKGW